MSGQETLRHGEGLSEKTQSRTRRGGKKAREDAPFSREGWVSVSLCYRLQLHCPGAAKVSGGRRGDVKWSPEDSCSGAEAWDSLNNQYRGLLVSGETIAIFSYAWLVMLSYTPVWKAAKPSAASDGRKWSCSVFFVLACVSCLVISAKLSSKSHGNCMSLNASKLGHWAGSSTTRKV